MQFRTEQHFVAARLVRSKGAHRTCADRQRFIEMSNTFLMLSRAAATDRGGLCLDGFEWNSIEPNWTIVEERISQLLLPKITMPPLVPP
jgi:hypothetical protein